MSTHAWNALVLAALLAIALFGAWLAGVAPLYRRPSRRSRYSRRLEAINHKLFGPHSPFVKWEDQESPDRTTTVVIVCRKGYSYSGDHDAISSRPNMPVCHLYLTGNDIFIRAIPTVVDELSHLLGSLCRIEEVPLL